MRRKRILSLIAAVATIFSYYFSAEASELRLIGMDFENYSFDAGSNSGFSEITEGAYTYPTRIDSTHGTSLAAVFTGEAVYSYELEKEIKDGVYRLEFEIQKPDYGAYTYLRLCNSACSSSDDTANMSETFVMNSTGYIGATEGSAGWNLVAGGKKFVPGRWNKVDMWLDFDNRKIIYYIDNEFFTEQPFRACISDIKKLDFYLPGTVFLDNIVLEKVAYSTARQMAETGQCVPDAYLTPIASKLETGRSGNIFFDKNDVRIKHMLDNVTNEPISINISYCIERYNGEVVSEWNDKAELSPGQHWESEIAPALPLYEIYKLKVSCADVGKGGVFESDCDFSVVNGVTDGMATKGFGINTGIMLRASDQVKNMDILAATGLGYFRDGITWNRMETQKGVYGLAEVDEQRLNEMMENAEKYNMDCYMLVDGYCALYYTGKNVPQTEEGLDSLEEMAYHLAKDYPSLTHFEWTNEVDSNRYSRMTYEAYEKSLERFYKGIKRGNPDAFVVGCCTGMQNWYFIEDVLRAGGGSYMDAISIHPYADVLTPETCDYVSLCRSIRDILDKYGYRGELWVTETGVSSSGFYATEYEQAAYLIRQYALNTAYDCADVMMTYAFMTDDSDSKDVESSFGIVHGGGGGYEPYSAKPAYLAVCNYFSMIGDSEYENMLTKDSASLYRYKCRNGESVIMMSADMAAEPVGLSLGADEAVMYDMYGNETKLVGIDGKYSFVLTDRPIYLKGSFTSFEFCEPEIYFEKAVFDAKCGEPQSIKIYNKSGEEFDVSTSAKPNISISGNASSLKQKLTLNAVINSDTGRYDYSYGRNDVGTMTNRDILTVTVLKDGKIYGSFPIGFNLTPPLYWEFKSRPYDSEARHWVGEILIKNTGTKSAVSGRIYFEEPTEMQQSAGEFEFTNLAPNEEKMFSFNIPKQLTDTWTKYIAVAELSTGERYEIVLGSVCGSRTDRPTAKSLEMGVVRHIKRAPTIDGRIDADEWNGGKQVDFDQSEVTYGSQGIVVAGMQEGESVGEGDGKDGKDDFSGTIYALWDEENLYYAAEVYDDIHYNIEPPVHWYMADDLFVDIAPTMVQRHVSRFDTALSDYKTLQFLHALYRIVDRKMPWNGKVDSADVAIRREGYVTTYEVRVPWKEIISGEMGYGSNFNLTIGVRDHDETRDKTFAFSQWKCLVGAEE